ncbi:MAG: hypothetical protein ACI9QC_000644, partial [Oceanicoccus sp.]
MPENTSSDSADFSGDLEQTIDHLIETTEDTPEDLKVKLEFAKATLKEGTNTLLGGLREKLQIKEDHELVLRSSMDARRDLADSIGRSLEG